MLAQRFRVRGIPLVERNVAVAADEERTVVVPVERDGCPITNADLFEIIVG